MSAIEASSKKIAEIISVIDGIAFQTNILAERCRGSRAVPVNRVAASQWSPASAYPRPAFGRCVRRSRA